MINFIKVQLVFFQYVTLAKVYWNTHIFSLMTNLTSSSPSSLNPLWPKTFLSPSWVLIGLPSL